VGIPDTCREIKIKAGCLGRRYLLSLLFVRWAFLIPFICHLLKFQLFLLAQGFQGLWSKPGGMQPEMPVCQVLHWDWLDASLDTLSPYLTATGIPQTIYLVVCVASTWLWAFGRNLLWVGWP